jgi:hypothetical protein
MSSQPAFVPYSVRLRAALWAVIGSFAALILWLACYLWVYAQNPSRAQEFGGLAWPRLPFLGSVGGVLAATRGHLRVRARGIMGAAVGSLLPIPLSLFQPVTTVSPTIRRTLLLNEPLGEGGRESLLILFGCAALTTALFLLCNVCWNPAKSTDAELPKQ